MTTSRLPLVADETDRNAWGTVLNDWLAKNVTARAFCLDAYGADPTGATSSDGAWDACYADAAAAVQTTGYASAASGALIVIGRGVYRFSVGKVDVPDVRIGLVGPGKSLATLFTTGSSGDLVHVHDTTGAPWGGAPVGGFALHGWTAGAGVNGFHYGDRDYGTVFDINARGFQGSGARAYWFHSPTNLQAEGTTAWALQSGNCDVGFDFDGNSANNSTDYGRWDLHTAGCGTGARFINQAHMVGGQLSLRGNIGGGGYTGTVTLLQVGASGSDTAKITGAQLHIGVEADSGSTTIQDFIIQGTDAYSGIVSCYGGIYLLNYTGTFNGGSVTGPAVFQFTGPVSPACYTVAQSTAGKWQAGAGITGFDSAGAGGQFFGSGAPASGLGGIGSYYFRSDTPSTANQRIYVKTGASTWTGIA